MSYLGASPACEVELVAAQVAEGTLNVAKAGGNAGTVVCGTNAEDAVVYLRAFLVFQGCGEHDRLAYPASFSRMLREREVQMVLLCFEPHHLWTW